MSLATAELPSDPDALRAFAAALQSELYAKTLHIEKLKAQLATLRRARFGQSSEKLDPQIDWLELAIGDIEEAGAVPSSSATRGSARGDRVAIARSVRRAREIGARCPIICRARPSPMPAPASARRAVPGACARSATKSARCSNMSLRTSRSSWTCSLKLSCRDCESITQPPMPNLPIERGRPGPGLIAHVLVRQVLRPSAAEPPVRHLRPRRREPLLLTARRLGRARRLAVAAGGGTDRRLRPRRPRRPCRRHADPGVQDPRWRTHEERTIVGRRARRGNLGLLEAAGRLLPLFPRPQGRARPGAARVRVGLSRTTNADAGFYKIKLNEPDPKTGRPRLLPVACWAHARRELFDEHARTKSAIALQALEKIGAIFGVERGINGQSAETRRAVRQSQSVPLLADLKVYLETSLARISGKSDLAKAIRAQLNRWEALCRFTEDGRLEMSNNAAERAIRPLTLGRRNWTFLGSDSRRRAGGGDLLHADPELQVQWREPRGLSR